MTSTSSSVPSVADAVTGIGDGFERPYIDLEEERESPVPHRYVHGGFVGGETRFSCYFPPADRYEGRFFQHFTPAPDTEFVAQGLRGQEDQIGFAFASGGYLVETNEGGTSGGPGTGVDATIAGYRANAAAADFSRTIARRLYGEHRPFGYAYGGSGGAYRTFGAAERTTGVWDGFVPYVAGSPMAAPNVFTVRMHAQRVLRDRLDAIVDAVEPGGSGDPFAGLADEEAEALREVTAMGFPIRSWFGHRTMGTQAFGVLYPAILQADPTYFEDFWTRPGYLGADPSSSVHRDRVRFETRVVEVLRRGDGPDLGPLAEQEDGPRGGVDEAFKGGDPRAAAIVAVRLEGAPDRWVRGAELQVLSGAAAGASAVLRGLHASLAVVDFPDLAGALDGLRAGDGVRVDNSNHLAAQTYHRHQVPGADYPVYDLFRDEAGRPVPPQRPFLLAPLFAAGAAGHVPTGRFDGRMILVESLLDREAYPWQADWYVQRAEEHLGDAVGDRFRVWFVDDALHGDIEAQEHPTHTISYLGVLHEALRSLVAWVERDKPASASTRYAVDGGQVILPKSADRLGVQPVLALTVDGADRTDVAAGADVRVRLVAETPVGAPPIARIDLDLDGDAVFEEHDDIEVAERALVDRVVRFTQPGTYFVAARVAAQRRDAAGTPFGRIDAVARARVVVG